MKRVRRSRVVEEAAGAAVSVAVEAVGQGENAIAGKRSY
jgi:hypothetical protein